MWRFFWPIYFNKNSLLVFFYDYRFITNFLPYFLQAYWITTWWNMVADVQLYSIMWFFFFVVKVNAGRFHDHNKMGPTEKNSIQEILYKMYYSLFKLTVLNWLLFSPLNLSWTIWKYKQTYIIVYCNMWLHCPSLVMHSAINCAKLQWTMSTKAMFPSVIAPASTYVVSDDLCIQIPQHKLEPLP